MPEPALRLVAANETAPRGGYAARLDGIVLERSGKRLLNGLSLALPAGGTTAVMGPNGVGKSLTLRLIAGLIEPDRGAIDISSAIGRTALVFQKPVLLRRSVRANLAHALASYGVPRGQRAARLAELLFLGRLAHLADRPARVLSGGEQQRVAMVRAMAGQPDLLLLDEPTASLDPQSTAHIEALIAQASADGVKIVLVTHDRHQAERLADDIVFMNRGRVVEQSPAHRFFQAPNSTEAQAFLEGRLLI